MPSMIQTLESRQLIRPPSFLAKNVHYEVLMGSFAYGVSSDTSDVDIYGWCIPPKDVIFPHLRGEILGFGRQAKRFDQFQADHVVMDGREHDMQIYSIVRYFQLCMENNPNMIDSLFVPENCVLHATQVGQMVREKRRMFLHKGCWHKFKGYAFSQMKKIRTKTAQEGSKRAALIEQFGFDVKFSYHVVRLLLEVEQILTEGDIDLQRGREQLKAIRRGEWLIEQIESFFSEKQKGLETVYLESKAVPYGPDEPAIKQLLLDCLEHHYGSLADAVVVGGSHMRALKEIIEIAGVAMREGRDA